MSADASNEPLNLQQVGLIVDTEHNCVKNLGQNYYNDTIQFCNIFDSTRSTCFVTLISDNLTEVFSMKIIN